MSNWREVRLSEVVDLISGYAFKTDDFKSTGEIPVIKIGNINFFDVDIYKNISYVDEALVNKLNDKFIVKNGDVLISLTGSNINQPNSMVGRVGRYRENSLSVLNQRAGKVIPKENVSKDFIYYLFSLNSMTYQIATVAYGGANQVNISPSIIKSFKIKIPDVKTQEKIANILSTYDKLIENNNRRIKILEKSAEEIYKEWFVRMRFPGYESARFNKGIPEGWKVKKVSELVDRLKYGNLYKEKDVEGEGRVIVIDQSEKEFLGFHNETADHFADINNPIILFGDHSCKMLVMTQPFSLSENVIPFKSIDDIPELFLYYTLKDLVRTSEYKRHWTELANKKILLPKRSLQLHFEKYIRSKNELIELYKHENLNLVKQRDLLLPRLMNGTIEVK